MIRIYDGNNHVRRRMESEGSIRAIFDEIDYRTGVKIVVWDGANELAQRRAFYDGYKRNRTPSPDNVYKSMDLLRELLKMTAAIQIRVPGYEADDVIARLVMKYGPAHIHSNDADFAQLPDVTLDREKFKVEPRWVRLYKATVGDPSDNIPGIKGFGEKAWEESNKDALETLMVAPWLPEHWGGLNLPKKCEAWLQEPGNLAQVQVYYKIVGFLEVPEQLIADNTAVGTPNRDAAVKILQEFLL